MENEVRAQASPDAHEAAAALHVVASSQAGRADRLITPSWYHPALGS